MSYSKTIKEGEDGEQKEKQSETQKTKNKLSFVSEYYKPTSLVIAGGGVKCISLCGVMKYLEKTNLIGGINKIYAVSSGALFALFFALGYTSKEMKKDIVRLSNKKIFGVDKILSTNILTLTSCIYDLYRNSAINNMDFLMKYIINIFERKRVYAGISFLNFKKISGISLNIISTNIDKCNIKRFCPEKTPNISIINALLGSMSIPFLFKSVKIGMYHYNDGGLMCNFPYKIADKLKCNDEEILKIYFSTVPGPIETNNYKHNENDIKIIDYISNILNIVFRVNIPSNNKDLINKGICEIKLPETNFIDFNLTKEQKKIFFDSGYNSIKKFVFNKLFLTN
jgi:NTE family protein